MAERDLVLIRGRSVDELRADFAGLELYESGLREVSREPAPVG